MKKVVGIIAVIGIIVGGHIILNTCHKKRHEIHHKTTHSEYNTNSNIRTNNTNTKGDNHVNKDDNTHHISHRYCYSYKDNYKMPSWYYDKVSFNKGYNNGFNKYAVAAANKEHSKVTLNNNFTVSGLDDVNGATNCTYLRGVDGDTLIANINGKNQSVRFYGIDSSEDVNPRVHCFEPYSVQAKDYVTSKLTPGTTIKIVLNNSKGKYGRTVGTIYYKNNGKWFNLNEEEVANGLARIAYLDKNNLNINVNKLYAAQQSALNQKLNIWSIKGYVTYWGYNLAIFN